MPTIKAPAPGLRRSPRRVYLTAFFLGFGLLLPWYAFLNSLPYFVGVFPVAPVAYYVTISFNSPQLPAQLALLATGKWPSPRLPLLVGYSVQAAVLFATPFLATRAIAALLALVAIAGAATAVVESALFGGCAELGANAASASQAVLAGEGVASVVANVVQLVLYTASPAQRATLTTAYLAGAAAVLLVCAALSFELARQVAKQKSQGDKMAEDDVSTPLFLRSLDSTTAVPVEDANAVASLTDSRTRAIGAFAQPLPSSTAVNRVATSVRLAINISYACWPTLLAIFGSMVLTFLVFPGVTADVPFTASDGGRDSTLREKGAWSLLLFFINAVGDLTGRAIAGTDVGGLTWLGGAEYESLDVEPAQPSDAGGALASPDRRRGIDSLLMRRVFATLAYNAARALTLPVFVAVARGWRPPHTDVLVSVNMVLFAVTNGHAQTLAMMIGPLQVKDEHRGTAAVLHVLCLIAGLWVGSAGALLLG